MSNQDCNCTDLTVDQTTGRADDSDGWIEERPVTTAQLPAGVAENMSRVFSEPIATLDDMTAAIRNIVEGDGIAVDELCHVKEETPHYARTDSESYYFRCFYDGIALAYLVDEEVEIHTETPTNAPIRIQASSERTVDVTPPDAVMSFGVTTDKEVPAGEFPTTKEVYEGICPYVKAFQTRSDYERWAADVLATTVGLPLESGVSIAAALTATSSSGEEKE